MENARPKLTTDCYIISSEDSDEDMVTDYSKIGMIAATGIKKLDDDDDGEFTPLIPTISITSSDSILEDSLNQLHDIMGTVQQMKDANMNTLSVNNRYLLGGGTDHRGIRLSTSCPSLDAIEKDESYSEDNNNTNLQHNIIVDALQEIKDDTDLPTAVVSSKNFLSSTFEHTVRLSYSCPSLVAAAANLKKSSSIQASNSFQSGSTNPFAEVLNNKKDLHCLEETGPVPLDFLDEGLITVGDMETDPFLGLEDEEPETWSLTVNKEFLKKLTDKEIKRQEHIYELILSEKHHCLTLRVMQKIFVEGFQKYFNLGINLNRMFPRLLDLTDIHLRFLYLLRERQREAPFIENIGDILSDQFSGETAVKFMSAYGEFCSKHRDAVNIYKYYLQHDSKFAVFVKHCQTNPLLKKKGIPECILFVTQRLTKYPLLIEPLIKTSKENKFELERLMEALAAVKKVLVAVDAKVEEKEKEEKKLEIYSKLESKSFTHFRGKKFKKNAILSNSRTLKFDGTAMLMHGRTKMQMTHVIVLSDVLFFLTENNNKYSFFTPFGGKEGVLSLQKLLVREEAGSDSRGIYLICSNLPNPKMYELKIHRPKEKQIWIKSIREAIRNCSAEDDLCNNRNPDDKQQSVEEQQLHIQNIAEALRQKDLEQAIILEEKISLQLKLLATNGARVPIEPPPYSNLLSDQLDSDVINKEVIYTLHRVQELTSSFFNCEVNLSRSVSSVGERQSNAYISPILPKRAETFGGFDNANKEQMPLRNSVVRKLSQQFHRKSPSAVDNKSTTTTNLEHPQKKTSLASFLEDQQLTWKNVLTMMGVNFHTTPAAAAATNMGSPISDSGGSSDCSGVSATKSAGNNVDPASKQSQVQVPSLLQMDKEAQSTVVELTSHIYTLATIIMKQMTVVDVLNAQIKTAQAKDDTDQATTNSATSERKEKKHIYNHSQQLEELRNLQDKLTREKQQWMQQKEVEEKDLEEKREQLLRLQEQIRNDQNDITLQREQLYRKLEAFSSSQQGILANSAGGGEVTGSPPAMLSMPPISLIDHPVSSDTNKRRTDSIRWSKQMPSKNSPLPLNLISATNQQKVSSNVQVKQKLPLKLASKFLSGTPVSSPSGGSISSPSTSSSFSPLQQILPLKLQHSSGTGGGVLELKYSGTGYQKLQSTEPSITPMHSRTGSSPAMMQNTDHTLTEIKEPNKAERTNTYPKIPEKYRVLADSDGKKPKNVTSEEEVIFF